MILCLSDLQYQASEGKCARYVARLLHTLTQDYLLTNVNIVNRSITDFNHIHRNVTDIWNDEN